MNNDQILLQCVNCERTVEEVPLVTITHRTGTAYICPQCFPILIHKPHLLVGKLAGAESLHAHEH